MKKLKTFFRKLFALIGIVVYTFAAICVTVFTGCSSVMPTKEPPLAEAIGYEIPDWKGWTTVGINEAVYKLEYEKLKVLRTMVNIVNEPALAAHEQAINWLNVGLSAGTFGGIPLAGALALKKLPKGAVKEEDHLAEVEKARMEQPPA